METITFETLPQAVFNISRRLENIERLLHENTPAPGDTIPEIMDVTKAAEFLSITQTTVRIKAAKRELPSMKRNGRLYFSKTELTEYLKAGRTPTRAEIMQAPAVANGLKPKKQTI